MMAAGGKGQGNGGAVRKGRARALPALSPADLAMLPSVPAPTPESRNDHPHKDDVQREPPVEPAVKLPPEPLIGSAHDVQPGPSVELAVPPLTAAATPAPPAATIDDPRPLVFGALALSATAMLVAVVLPWVTMAPYADRPVGEARPRSSDLNGLASRADGLEQQLGALRRANLAAALAALERAASGGGGFAAELRTLETAARDEPAIGAMIAALAPLAGRAISQPGALIERYHALAADAPLVDLAGPQPGWLAQAGARLLLAAGGAGLPVGTVSPAVQAALEGAAAAAARGDVPAMAASLRALEGPVADHFAAWLADADARLGLEETLAALQRQLAAPPPTNSERR